VHASIDRQRHPSVQKFNSINNTHTLSFNLAQIYLKLSKRLTILIITSHHFSSFYEQRKVNSSRELSSKHQRLLISNLLLLSFYSSSNDSSIGTIASPRENPSFFSFVYFSFLYLRQDSSESASFVSRSHLYSNLKHEANVGS